MPDLIYVYHLGSTNVPGGVNTALAAQCRAMGSAGVRSHVDYVVRAAPHEVVETFARNRIDAFVSTRSVAAAATVLRALASRVLLGRSNVVVHLHSGLPVTTPGMLAVRRVVPHHIPCVATFHGASSLVPRDQHRAMWDRHVRNVGVWDLATVPSRCELDAQTQAGASAELMACVENAVFMNGGSPEARGAPTDGTPPPHQLVFVGRLSVEKNVAPVLRAFASVAASDPAATLLCLGDGPERAALSALEIELHSDRKPEAETLLTQQSAAEIQPVK